MQAISNLPRKGHGKTATYFDAKGRAFEPPPMPVSSNSYFVATEEDLPPPDQDDDDVFEVPHLPKADGRTEAEADADAAALLADLTNDNGEDALLQTRKTVPREVNSPTPSNNVRQRTTTPLPPPSISARPSPTKYYVTEDMKIEEVERIVNLAMPDLDTDWIRTHRVDGAVFQRLGMAYLSAMGIEAMGDKIKLQTLQQENMYQQQQQPERPLLPQKGKSVGKVELAAICAVCTYGSGDHLLNCFTEELGEVSASYRISFQC